MTEHIKKYLNAITDAGAVFEPSHIGGVKGYKAQLSSQKPHELVMRYRLELQNLGMSIFVGDSAPCNPTSIEEILSQLYSTGQVKSEENWEELWITPRLNISEIFKIIKSSGFPDGLLTHTNNAKIYALNACFEFLSSATKKQDFDLILIKPSLCMFAFAQSLISSQTLEITRQALELSSQYFKMGPYKNRNLNAWSKDGIFGIGCA